MSRQMYAVCLKCLFFRWLRTFLSALGQSAYPISGRGDGAHQRHAPRLALATEGTTFAKAQPRLTRLFFSVFSVVLLVSFGLPAPGQSSSSAAVTGIVQDTTEARIPNANVKLINTDTGTESGSTTGKDGNFVIPSVLPGHYRLQIERDGFDTTQLTGITLNVGDNKEVIIRMKVGSSQQTVTVDASGVNLNTTDGSVSTVVDRQFVTNMPLNGRSFQDLILLTPGVVTNSPQQNGASGYNGEFSVNGQRTESNVYTVDGVNANTGGYIYGYGTPGTSGSLPAATALGTTQSLVSVDALQEFRVASSSYSAEYGTSPGGQFSFTTRSGTNQIHGSAFDYLRNNFFDANDWFNDYFNKPPTSLRQNDFGGTLGGPIWVPRLYDGKGRSFFFFSYEGLRLVQPQAAIMNYVPSLEMRQTAPAALQPVLNAFPVPSGPALSNGLAPFIQTDSLPSHIDSTSVRLDQQITPKLRLFFRFADTQSSTETRSLSNLTATAQSSYSSTLGLTTTLSEHMVNDFRLNYTSNLGESNSTLDNFGDASPVNLLTLQGIGDTGSDEVGLYFPSYRTYLIEGPTLQPQHGWNVKDSTTFSHGRQSLKFGIDYRETASRLQNSDPYLASIFRSSQQVLTNSPIESLAETYARSYPAYTNTGLYIQDEIRETPRFGISVGLRWEVNPPPTQTSGSLPYIVQGDLSNPSSLGLAPAGSRFWRTTYFNFAPRLGVAYQAHNQPGRETVLRAGGGIFFDSGQQTSTQAFGNSPGQFAQEIYTTASYPMTPAQVNVPLVIPPVAPYGSAYYFPGRLQLPYTLQWNVAVEQALGQSQAVTFTYVGSNGRRLLSQQELTGTSVGSSFSYIDFETSGTTSNYNALQVKFQRALSRDLQILASYNWAHSIDFGSQNIAFSQIRGNSDYDLRQNVNFAATYDINPVGLDRLMRTLVDHWAVDSRFSARTAYPVILNGNTITEPDGQQGYSGLDIVPGAPLYIHVDGIAGSRQVNPAAFSLPATGKQGDAPRNFVRGFGTNELDVAVRRQFSIVERLNLQFRAEAFNVLNHPNFGYINPNYGNTQFGQATEMLNQSLGNLSPLYQQGGPRSMQFSLRLAF